MARTTARKWFTSLAVASLVLSVSAGSAWAGWGNGSSGGSWGSSGGSSGGSWGSSGGSSGGSWGGSSGSSGGGLFSRLHKHFHHSSGGSSGGGWGSSGGSHGSSGGSHGSSGGSHGSSGGYSRYQGSNGGTYYSAPSNVPPETRGKPADASDAPMDPDALPRPSTEGASNRTGQAVLAVTVPEEAKVFVNGVRTTSTGANRQYVSRGLLSGYTYTYEVRMEVERDGQVIEESKTAYLRVGENSRLAFELPKTAAPTVLTLKVPADAKVFLGGNETAAKGTVRTFSTTNLRDGQEWSSYKVRIEFEQNGETVVKESTIALKAGDQRTLEVGVDSERVASKR